jgi:nucleotide-binding universal stress UspA family protein
MFKNLLVGADSSATALRAVETAVDLAKTCGAKLHIVTAYKPQAVRIPDLPSEYLDANYLPPADSLLEELISVAKRAKVEAEIHAATGDPAEAIVRLAASIGADLIIVGNKGMRGARRVLGSVPNTIAHQAPCSVLIVDTTSAAQLAKTR